MTSRERMLRGIRGEAVDRVPVSPWGFGRVDPASAVGRELIARCDPWIEARGGGFAFAGARLEAETTQDGDLTTTVYHTPAGDLRARRQRTSVTAATVEFPCKTAADVEALLAVPYEPVPTDFAPFHETRARYGDAGLVGMGCPNAVCWPATVLSPEDLCLLWADAPDLLAEMTRLANERLCAYIEAACRAGVDCFRIIGGEYVTVQLGPAGVPRLLAPFDTDLVGVMHHYGAVAHYHNHGPMMAFLDALADLGIDSLDPCEAAPWGDCDLAEAQRVLAGRTCIVGNLDDMEIVERRPEAEVCALAAERLERAGDRHFMLGGTASGTYTDRAARTFIALVGVAEAYAARS
ncbi:MAG: uroporphyrinogen decarboxylase family protein [Planctomycetota bacterium]